MLGNWSFGDYFKEEQLKMFYTFLSEKLKLDMSRIYVTFFSGDEQNNLPADEQTKQLWIKMGMPENHIFGYGVEDNWWSRAGVPNNMPIGEPGGPDSEVFYEFTEILHDLSYGEQCGPACKCGRFIEIGNSVFMMYKKVDDKKFIDLPKKNIDFGGGLERMALAVADQTDMFMAVDVLKNIVVEIEKITGQKYDDNKQGFRVIADHIRASIFMISDGVRPSNKDAGYMLRRLIRRSVMKMYQLNISEPSWLESLVSIVINSYSDIYQELGANKELINDELQREAKRFYQTINQGLKIFNKLEKISGHDAFILFTSHGFPFELTQEIAKEKGIDVDAEEYNKLFEEHRALSKEHSQRKFGGHGLLLDNGEIKAANEEELKQCTKLHTATHLLQAALRVVLGDEVHQDGSDITAQRLRFDFTFKRKMTDDEKKQVEDLVNSKINTNLDVWFDNMKKEEALKSGALYFHKVNYPDVVKVYSMGFRNKEIFSKEFCAGPHVDHTIEVGKFKIIKEESISSGTRRIKAIVE